MAEESVLRRAKQAIPASSVFNRFLQFFQKVRDEKSR